MNHPDNLTQRVSPFKLVSVHTNSFICKVLFFTEHVFFSLQQASMENTSSSTKIRRRCYSVLCQCINMLHLFMALKQKSIDHHSECGSEGKCSAEFRPGCQAESEQLVSSHDMREKSIYCVCGILDFNT